MNAQDYTNEGRKGSLVNPVQLLWDHKSLRPVVVNSGYRWVPTTSTRRVRPLRFELGVGEPCESLLVHGDATDALAALALRYEHRDGYAGRVKLCYIDPPFNTGEHFEHYSDRADSSAWLGLLREHLVQIKKLLAPDGSVWLHLDDSEQHRARCILDEIFGTSAFVATVIWQKRVSRDNRKAFSSMHDYIHVYAPGGPIAWKRARNGLPDTGEFSNPDNDPRGPWRSAPMTAQAGHATASQFYTVTSPTGVEHDPPPGRCWTYTSERLTELDADGLVYWPRAGSGKPRLKRYASQGTTLAPFTIWNAEEVGSTSSAKKALLKQFPGLPTFDTPKPEALIERIVRVGSNEGELVLDSYLGSGTTAVVAQRLGRPWIGIERNSRAITEFALPRIQRERDASGGTGFSLARTQ